MEVTEIPAEYKEQAAKYRQELIEIAAEQDDELLEKYFAGEELTVEDIKNKSDEYCRCVDRILG